MKGLVRNIVLCAAIAGLSACARHTLLNDTDTCDECPSTQVQQPAPVQQPVYQVSQGCQGSEYTVRTPVEVIYKNVTYRTVYVPQTTQSVAYEKRPYNYEEMCANGRCAYAK